MGLFSRRKNQYDSSKAAPDKPATIVKNRNGKDVVLLPPQMKGRKAAFELRTGMKYTNDFKPKEDAAGNPIELTPEEKAYRGGYLDARKDIGKAAASARMKEAEREERDAKAQRRMRKSFTDEQVATYETWQREQAAKDNARN